MSPELERLLNALWERQFCEPKDRFRWEATVERLIADALARQQGVSREQFMDAVWPRYEEFRRARRKPPTMPPRA
jgi:hypothetical protein